MQNLVYIGTFKHIQAYSIIIVNTFFFSTKFKKTCFLTTVTSISMLD